MNVNKNNKKNSNSFLPDLSQKKKRIENKLSLKKNNRNSFNTSLYSIYSNNNNNIKLKSNIEKYNSSNFSDNSNNFEQNIFEYKNVIKNFEKHKPIKLNKNLLVLSDDNINKKNYTNKKNSTNLVNILNNGNNDKNVEINFNKYEIKILSDKHNKLNNKNNINNNKNIYSYNSSNENVNSEFNYKTYKKQHSKSNGEIMEIKKKNNYLEITKNMQFYINNSSNKIMKKNSFKIISQNYLIGGISSTNESDNNMKMNKNKYYIKEKKNKYNNFLKTHSNSLNNTKIKDILNNNKKEINHTKFLSNSNLNYRKYSPILKLDLQSQRTSSNENEKSINKKISSSNLSSCEFFDNKNENKIKNINTSMSHKKSKREKKTLSSYNSEKIIINSDIENNDNKKEIQEKNIFKTPKTKESDFLSKLSLWTKNENLKKKIKIKLKKKKSKLNYKNIQNFDFDSSNSEYNSQNIKEFKNISDIDIKSDNNSSVNESFKNKKKNSENNLKKIKPIKQNIKKLNLIPLIKKFPIKTIKKQLTIVDEFKEDDKNYNNNYENDDLSVLTSPTNYIKYKPKLKLQITNHPPIDIKRQNTFPFILKEKNYDNKEYHSFNHNSFKNYKSLSIFEKILYFQQSMKKIVNEGYQTNEDTSPINSSLSHYGIKNKIKKNHSSQIISLNNLDLKQSSVRINKKFHFKKLNEDISESVIEKNKKFLKKIINENILKNKLDDIEINNQINKDEYINKSVMKFDIIVNKIYESNKENLQKISKSKLNLYFKSNQIKIQNFFKNEIDYSNFQKRKIRFHIFLLKFNFPFQFKSYILNKYFKVEIIDTILKGTFLNNDFNHNNFDNVNVNNNKNNYNEVITLFENFNLLKTRRKSSVRKSIFRLRAIRFSKTIYLNFISQKFLNKFYLKEWGIEDVVIKEIKFVTASYTTTKKQFLLPIKSFKNLLTKNSMNYKSYLRYSSRKLSNNSLINGLSSLRKKTKYLSKKLLLNNGKKNTLLNYLRQDDGILHDKQFFERIRDDFFNIEFSKIQKDRNFRRKSIIQRKEEKIYSSPFKRFSITELYNNVQETPRNSFNKETMMYETHKIKSNIIKKCDDMKDILFLYIKDRNYQNFANKFIKYKINKDNRDDDGNTYLNLAIQCDSKEITNFLIKWGADPNIGNNKMNTPLHYALSYQNFELADILINAGADESIKNYDGLTPWQCVNINHSIM